MPRLNDIRIRSGTAAPSAGDFNVAEPAWDATAGKLYVKNAAGQMVEIGAGAGGGGTTEVLEYATPAAFPSTGTAARLYVATDTSRVYRWDAAGSVYVEVGSRSPSPIAASLIWG
jgi:hypothetical protein